VVKKSPNKKAAAKSAPASSPARGGKGKATSAADDGELGPFPTDDPQAQAEYLLALLDRLAEQGDPRADNMRLALLLVIKQYLEARLAGEDMQVAGRQAAAQLIELESTIADVLLGSLHKLRDKVTHESRRLGTGSKAGQQARHAAEGLDLMSQGLDLLIAASRDGDEAKRAQAHAILKKAQQTVEAIR
jgi:hypothetical protein